MICMHNFSVIDLETDNADASNIIEYASIIIIFFFLRWRFNSSLVHEIPVARLL